MPYQLRVGNIINFVKYSIEHIMAAGEPSWIRRPKYPKPRTLKERLIFIIKILALRKR